MTTEMAAGPKHVYFDRIRHGGEGRSNNLYACLRDCSTGELTISADMEYCLQAIRERGWVVEPGIWAGINPKSEAAHES